jgi:hypothetical protein
MSELTGQHTNTGRFIKTSASTKRTRVVIHTATEADTFKDITVNVFGDDLSGGVNNMKFHCNHDELLALYKASSNMLDALGICNE